MAVLTISRQFGAGGITLGKMASEKLGYHFYDEEIIQLVAKKAKVSKHWVESMEKEAGGKFQRLISGLVSKSLVDRILDDQRGYMDEDIYVDLLHTVIRKIADEGEAVIIGRGSQYILRDHKDACHVLLVADKEHRIKFIKERYNLSTDKATRVVSTEEKKRTALYRKFGKEDYDQPLHYHMVLNMNKTDLHAALKLMSRLVTSK